MKKILLESKSCTFSFCFMVPVSRVLRLVEGYEGAFGWSTQTSKNVFSNVLQSPLDEMSGAARSGCDPSTSSLLRGRSLGSGMTSRQTSFCIVTFKSPVVVSHGHISTLLADEGVADAVLLTTPTEMRHVLNVPAISQTYGISELLLVQRITIVLER